jgi:hypothetical protein
MHNWSSQQKRNLKNTKKEKSENKGTRIRIFFQKKESLLFDSSACVQPRSASTCALVISA